MTLAKSVDRSCRSLEAYFARLFELIVIGEAEEDAAPIEAEDASATESQAPYHGFSHLIKPSMVIYVCSLLDFWIRELSNYHQIRKQLQLSYNDIKGHDDLCAIHKYLTQYIGLDLESVKGSYKHLQDLRKIRNRSIHSGGYVPDGNRNDFSGIRGVSLSWGGLIMVEDEYIWSSLDHAKKYLKAIVLAYN